MPPDSDVRRAVRALVLTPNNEVLLLHCREPESGLELWITPGGGLHDNESSAQCLRRELREETGLGTFELGPRVWSRDHSFMWGGKKIRQREEYFLAWTKKFEATMDHNPEPGERSAFLGFRWWQIEEIETSSDLFGPSQLGVHLRRLIDHGLPNGVIEIDA